MFIELNHGSDYIEIDYLCEWIKNFSHLKLSTIISKKPLISITIFNNKIKEKWYYNFSY